jgi:hypothetical protein
MQLAACTLHMQPKVVLVCCLVLPNRLKPLPLLALPLFLNDVTR